MAVLVVAMLLTLGKGGWMILATVVRHVHDRRSIGRLVAVVAVVGVVALGSAR
jgi:hypothetical protein